MCEFNYQPFKRSATIRKVEKQKKREKEMQEVLVQHYIIDLDGIG